MILYRGGPDSEMPRGLTAADVIAYEREELGNSITVNGEYDLPSIAARELVWLTATPEDAAEYGEVTECPVVEPVRVIATDPFGGMLVWPHL
jgi:hypothetical protein